MGSSLSSSSLLNPSAPKGGAGSREAALTALSQGVGENEWEELWHGHATSFTDTALVPHLEYRYRLQSWNALGHSDWVFVDSLSTQDAVCSPADRVKLNGWMGSWRHVDTFGEFFETTFWLLQLFFNFAFSSVQFLLAILAVLSALFRLRK